LGCSFDEVPVAGMYLWARLPGGVDAQVVAERLARDGHLMAPGRLFTQYPAMASHMRFNVSNTLDSPALAALAALLPAR